MTSTSRKCCSALALIAAAACTKPAPEWSDAPLTGTINELSAVAADDVWGVGAPHVFHYDGKTWVNAGALNVEHLAAAAHGDVWAVGKTGNAWHYDGTSWQRLRAVQLAREFKDFAGVVAWPGEVWATASDDGTYYTFNGSIWVEVKPPELQGWQLQQLSQVGRHVFVGLSKGRGEAGQRTFESKLGHWDGQAWSLIDQPAGLRVRGSAPDDLWLVMPTPRHFDGNGWSETDLPEKHAVNDLYVRSKTEAYLVGEKGFAAKWDGKTWHTVPTGIQRDLFAVVGASDGPIWATGQGAKLLRYPKVVQSPVGSTQ